MSTNLQKAREISQLADSFGIFLHLMPQIKILGGNAYNGWYVSKRENNNFLGDSIGELKI